MYLRATTQRRRVSHNLLLFIAAFAWFAAIPLVAQEPAAPTTPASSTAQATEDKLVLSIGDDKIFASQIQEILDSLPPQSRNYYAGEGRNALPLYLVRLKMMAAEARKRKLDQDESVQRGIRFATESVLADAAIKDLLRNIPITEEQVQELYQRRSKEFEQVRVRRILIRTEGSILDASNAATKPPLSGADARAKLEGIRKKIADGASFEEMAKENSDDPETAPRGGDAGFISFQQVIPPIANAAFSLEPGKMSEVIPTPFGMELIQVVERRTIPLEEIRPMLEGNLRQSMMDERMQMLSGEYKIFVDTEYFMRAAGSAAPMGLSSAPAPRQ